MSTDNFSACANCGKGEEEGEAALKNCVACKMVKYCSRDCQKAHRSQHKRECRKRAAELHDEKLFQQSPQKEEECPICFLTLPFFQTGKRYNACCGKIICSGCIHAVAKLDNEEKCPFCRTPAPETDEEIIKTVRKRVEIGDAQAVNNLGCCYEEGSFDFPQDVSKALELWHRAAELGNAASYYNIGNAYMQVESDEKKAVHYWELAVMGGDIGARHSLGCREGVAGNMERALKHFMIAVGSGNHGSLKVIKQFYLNGRATRDDYSNALQAYQAYVEDIKSDDRDKAAAFDDEFKYYE